MKRAIISIGVVSIFVFVAIASHALYTKKPITTKDLPTMKGKWEGERVIQDIRGENKYPVDLEINNDKLPLQGKMTLHKVMKAGQKDRTEIMGLKNSEINKEGNLLIKGQQFQVELSLYVEEGKMKLEGDYQFEGLRGTLTVYKK
jgi:hypothetical protein